jgi:ribosomal-protein-alanine N-acetyltransferase
MEETTRGHKVRTRLEPRTRILLLKRDIPRVMEIERSSFEFPYSQDDMLALLRQQSVNGLVVEVNRRVVAYLVYDLKRTEVEILSVAVDAAYRNQGIGKMLVGKMVAKLNENRRYLSLLVRETNLDAQLFFKATGFLAIDVIRGEYEDTKEDAFYFVRGIR